MLSVCSGQPFTACFPPLLIAALLQDTEKNSMLNQPDLILSGKNKPLPILQLHQLREVFLVAQVCGFSYRYVGR